MKKFLAFIIILLVYIYNIPVFFFLFLVGFWEWDLKHLEHYSTNVLAGIEPLLTGIFPKSK